MDDKSKYLDNASTLISGWKLHLELRLKTYWATASLPNTPSLYCASTSTWTCTVSLVKHYIIFWFTVVKISFLFSSFPFSCPLPTKEEFCYLKLSHLSPIMLTCNRWSTWPCLEIRLQDKVIVQRLIIIPLKGWNNWNIWELT